MLSWEKIKQLLQKSKKYGSYEIDHAGHLNTTDNKFVETLP